MTNTLFRFMPMRRVDDFLSGKSVKYGTLDEYRGFKSRQDEYARTKLGQFLSQHQRDGEGDWRLGLELQRLGIDVDDDNCVSGINDVWEGVSAGHLDNGDNVRSNLILTIPVNKVIFCGSNRVSVEVVERMRQDSVKYGGQPYDACVPILNVNRFSRILMRALNVKFGNPFFRFIVKDVLYEKSIPTTPNMARPLPEFDEFVKEPSYASQSEKRIVFDPTIPRFEFGEGIKFDRSIEDLCGPVVNLTKEFPKNMNREQGRGDG